MVWGEELVKISARLWHSWYFRMVQEFAYPSVWGQYHHCVGLYLPQESAWGWWWEWCRGSGITSFLPPVPLSPLASPFLPSLPPLFLPPFLPLLFFLKQCLLSIYSCQAMHSDVQKLILYSGSLQSSRGQICLKSNDHSNKCRMNNYSKLMKRQMIP